MSKKMNLPHEFPNLFGKMGGELEFSAGEPVSSLAWVGMKRELLFSEKITRENYDEEGRIPQYLIITPGVLAYTQDGNRTPQLLSTHEVWISMN